MPETAEAVPENTNDRTAAAPSTLTVDLMVFLSRWGPFQATEWNVTLKPLQFAHWNTVWLPGSVSCLDQA